MTPALLSRPLRSFLFAAGLTASVFATACPGQAQEDPGPGPVQRSSPMTSRQRDVLRGIAEHAPFSCPERYVLELGPVPQRTPWLLEAMRAEPSWVRFMAYASRLEWTPAQAGANLDGLWARLPPAGKVRQNGIFLVALTAPDALQRLKALREREGLDAADRADVGCALAALGDPAAVRWFAETLAPSECMRGQPVFRFQDYQALEQREAGREQIRTYRTWEVLMGRPYFRRLSLLQPSLYVLRRGAKEEAARRALIRALLPAFLRVWPGHPGSDDFAATLCHEALAASDRLEAYRWAVRSTLLPDRDRGLNRTFTALAESQLSRAEVSSLLDHAEDGRHNRAFLRYTNFLKLAREDLAAGLKDFDECAEDQGSVFARARRAAAEVDVPAGLRDGLDRALNLEVLVAYPQRSAALARTSTLRTSDDDARFMSVLSSHEREVARRTGLGAVDSISLDVGELARQYRLLVELRELERLDVEAGQAGKAERQAELRTKRARLLYMNPGAYFPVWGRHHLSFGYDLNAVRCDAQADGRLAAYVAQAFHLRRAHALYASVLAEFPRFTGRDRVLNGLAQCAAKLMDYRPAVAVDVWVHPDPRPQSGSEKAFLHGRVADWFERLVREHPASPLAEAAERAASYRRGAQRREAVRARSEGGR